MSAYINLLSFPEELLERILEEVVLCSSSSFSSYALSPESPSRTLGPSPVSSPTTTPKSTPCITRHASPSASPIQSRPSSPIFGRSSMDMDVVHPTITTTAPAPATNPRLELALAPLLTCRQFCRIALPLYYRVVVLKTRAQAASFLRSGLGCHIAGDGGDKRRQRARWIRRLVLVGVWKEGGQVVRVLAELADKLALKVLEITIDAALPSALGSSNNLLGGIGRFAIPAPAKVDEDVEVFASALRAYADSWSLRENPLKHIVLRKPQNVYLTQPRAKSVIAAVAGVVESAEALESAFVAFKISDDPSGGHPYQQPRAQQLHHHASIPPQPQQPEQQPQPGPITQLTSALATRPQLKTFVTMLPSVWNEAVLRVSSNKALERIVLLGVNGLPVCSSPPTSPDVQQQRVSSPVSTAPAGVSARSGATNGPASRKPRLAVVLPSNPVERVYPSNAPAGPVGYGGSGYVPGLGTGTGLFMNQAGKHERLYTLIRCGAEEEDSCRR